MRKLIGFIAGLALCAVSYGQTWTRSPTLTPTHTPTHTHTYTHTFTHTHTLTVVGDTVGGEIASDKQVLNDVWNQTVHVLGVEGAVGEGTPVTGDPVLSGLEDENGDTRYQQSDTTGRFRVVGTAGEATPTAGDPVMQGLEDESGDVRYGQGDTTGRYRVVGTSGEGTPIAGDPVMFGLEDESGDARYGQGDTAGRIRVVGSAADGATAVSDPVRGGGVDHDGNVQSFTSSRDGAQFVHGDRHTLDICDSASAWVSVGDADNISTDVIHLAGTVSLEWDKGAGDGISSSIGKTITAVPLYHNADMNVEYDFYIPDATALADIEYTFVRIGEDNSNYLEYRMDEDYLLEGWNAIQNSMHSPDAQVGAGLSTSNIKYIEVGCVTNDAGDTIADMYVDGINVHHLMMASVLSGPFEELDIGTVKIKDRNSSARLDVEQDGSKNAAFVQSESLASEATLDNLFDEAVTIKTMTTDTLAEAVTIKTMITDLLAEAVTIKTDMDELNDKAVTIDTDNVHSGIPNLTNSTILIDISKDPRYSASAPWNGGKGGVIRPAVDSGDTLCYLSSEELPAGGMPLIAGIDPADYVLMLYMAEDAADTNAYDHSGNDNTFTSATNTNTISDSRPPMLGNAFTFNGSTEYLSRADDADFDIAIDESAVWGCWFKHNTASDYEVMFRRYTGDGFGVLSTPTGTIMFYLSDDNFATQDTIETVAEYDDNEWHLLVCVLEVRANMRIYIDGVDVKNGAMSNCVAAIDGNTAFDIGEGALAAQRWTGSLDGLFMYVAVDYPTAGEVLTHYNAASSAQGILYQINTGNTADLSVSLLWRYGSSECSTGHYLDLTNYLRGYTGHIRFATSADQTADRTFTVHRSQ